MVTDRLLEATDEQWLADSLATDVHHQGTTVAFFKQAGTMSRVYENESNVPICVARAAKSLRVDIQFVSNENKHDNATALVQGFPALAQAAKDSGYTEIYFTTSNPELAKFCQRVLKYELVPDKYVLRCKL